MVCRHRRYVEGIGSDNGCILTNWSNKIHLCISQFIYTSNDFHRLELIFDIIAFLLFFIKHKHILLAVGIHNGIIW